MSADSAVIPSYLTKPWSRCCCEGIGRRDLHLQLTLHKEITLDNMGGLHPIS